ncbi:THAP domain-containing 1-like [Paramuricea clavata]|uniref:THAP domain-containing 1-like n=1 Tax=Paramuricea clavata TaxID=317549 RepID=A0A6S7KV24_PARCT|nr:THAP domain-containing 1-like [Paramuricea clavata]
MPKRCVVYGCSNVADTNKDISIYQIPFWDDNSPVAVRRRKIWLSFVRRRRDKWIPTSSSVVCSKHFTEDCFVYGSESVEKYNTPRLKRDEHGIRVFPTVDTNQLSGSAESERTSRMKRRKELVGNSDETLTTSTADEPDVEPCTSTEQGEMITETVAVDECDNCKLLKKENLRIRSESSREDIHGGNEGDVESDVESDVEEVECESEELSDDVGEMETETETSDTETDEDTSVPPQRQGINLLF